MTTSASIVAAPVTFSICAATSSRFFGNRSASSPATSPSTNMGSMRKVPTSATSIGESVRSRTSQEATASSIIMQVIQSQAANHSRRNDGWASDWNGEGRGEG